MEFKDEGRKEGGKGGKEGREKEYKFGIFSLVNSLYRPMFLGYVALKFQAACDKPKPRTGQRLPYQAPMR